MTNTEIHQQPTWERVSIFAAGFVLISALIWIALIVPQPTDFQYTVFRIVLALSGAAFAALIPGSIDLKYRGAIRAGGAVAVLVIVFFFKTAPPTSSNPTHGDISIIGDCNAVGSSASISCNNR